MTSLPYWRLSAFYLFFFAIVGSLSPYWGPYLKALGFSPAQIGELIAITHLSRIVAPSVWGSLSDRLGQRMRVVRLATFVAFISFAGVLLGSGFWWLAGVMTVFSFFWHAALPQFEANTLSHLGAQEHRYSRIRVWGSIGFILAVAGLGEAMDRLGVQIVPLAILVLFAALWLSSLLAPEREGGVARHQGKEFLEILLTPAVVGFLLASFLSQMAHGPYYAFFTIFMQDHGYGSDLIGLLWAWGVVAEIGVFMVMHRWLPAYGPRALMSIALALGALRWLLIGAVPENLPLIVLAQTLHAASFGVYHAVGIIVVNRLFAGRSQGRGQAIYSMTFGGGVALGSLLSGYLWEPLGGSAVYYLAAAVSLLAAVAAFYSLPRRLAAPAVHH